MTPFAAQQFASFVVSDLLLGIEVVRVREVTGAVEITPVPLGPEAVRGVMNLRGEIVTAVDLRTCLQLGEAASPDRLVNVILQTADGISLLADEVGDVLEVDDQAFELPPATLRGRLRELIRGAYKLDGRLLLVLDTDRLLEGIGEA